MSINFLISQAKLIQEVIDAHATEIEKLDQEIGDGDHIFNVQRGIKLVIELEPTIKELPISKALNQIAMKVLSGIGGSSGALFGTLFMTMAKGENIDEGVDYKKAIQIFKQAGFLHHSPLIMRCISGWEYMPAANSYVPEFLNSSAAFFAKV